MATYFLLICLIDGYLFDWWLLIWLLYSLPAINNWWQLTYLYFQIYKSPTKTLAGGIKRLAGVLTIVYKRPVILLSQALSLAWSLNYSSIISSSVILPFSPITLANLPSEVYIYSEDILCPVSSLRYLSTLVVLQSLLNFRDQQDYLRHTFPFWTRPGWSA